MIPKANESVDTAAQGPNPAHLHLRQPSQTSEGEFGGATPLGEVLRTPAGGIGLTSTNGEASGQYRDDDEQQGLEAFPAPLGSPQRFRSDAITPRHEKGAVDGMPKSVTFLGEVQPERPATQPERAVLPATPRRIALS